MAADKGFLERLTGSSGDETSQAEQLRLELLSRGGAGTATALGMGARGAIGGLIGGVTGLIQGGEGRSLRGFADNVQGGAQMARDRATGQMLGISGEEVASRRRMRQELGRQEITDDGSFDARIRMAERAASIANAMGDSAGLARALSTVDSLKREKREFDKLSAVATQEEAQAVEEGIKTGFDSTGKPLTGVLDIKDGRAGLVVTEGGETKFRPFDEGFSLHDPEKARAGGARETVARRLSRISSTSERAKIRSLASSANSSINRTDRVLSTLTDLYEKGGVESVIGMSGGLISSIDNFARNMNGIIQAFSSRGAARDGKLRGGLAARADDAGDTLSKLIQLPPGVEATSAAAQQHRANVMEMAYMAARLAEPSNRGLSDNDIANALTRIAGDTSNPQVMVRRFLEMQIDAASELDFNLRLFHGSLGEEVSDAEIDMVLGGKGIPEYRERKQALFEKFGIREGDGGRAIFEEGAAIGTDVQPGEGVIDEPADMNEQSDEEFLDSLLEDI